MKRRRKLNTKNKNQILALALSPDGNLIAVSHFPDAKNKACSVWDKKTGKEIMSIDDINIKITSLCFSFDSHIIFYSINNKNLYAWDLKKDKIRNVVISMDYVQNIVSSKKTNRIAISGNLTSVWETDNFTSLWELENYPVGIIKPVPVSFQKASAAGFSIGNTYETSAPSIYLSDDGEVLFLCGNDTTVISAISINDAKAINTYTNAPIQSKSIDCNKKNNLIAVIGIIPNGNFLWDLRTNKPILTGSFNYHRKSSASFSLHPEKKISADGSAVGYVSLRDLTNGNFLFSKQLHNGNVSQLVFTPDGSELISAADDGCVFITDITDYIK